MKSVNTDSECFRARQVWLRLFCAHADAEKRVFPYSNECIIIDEVVFLTERWDMHGKKDRNERHIGKSTKR